MDKQQFMASSNFVDISEATNEYYIAVVIKWQIWTWIRLQLKSICILF